jgi:hypothetical protein
MPRRLPLAFALMASGVYIIVPTPDELVVHPLTGCLLSRYLHVSIQTGVMLSVGAYLSIGFAFIVSSIVIGGTVILDELNRRMAEEGAHLGRYISVSLTYVPEPGDRRGVKYSEGASVLAASPFERFD